MHFSIFQFFYFTLDFLNNQKMKLKRFQIISLRQITQKAIFDQNQFYYF